MNFPRLVTRVLNAFLASKLERRSRRNAARLLKMRPDLARNTSRWAIAASRNKRSAKLHKTAVHTMNDLLRS